MRPRDPGAGRIPRPHLPALVVRLVEAGRRGGQAAVHAPGSRSRGARERRAGVARRRRAGPAPRRPAAVTLQVAWGPRPGAPIGRIQAVTGQGSFGRLSLGDLAAILTSLLWTVWGHLL